MIETKRRVCVVTGASRGIGAATARLAGRSGYAVCVTYLHTAEKAETVVAEIERAGGVAMAYRADVGNAADVGKLFRAVDDTLGPVTALVNSAATPGGRHAFLDVDGVLLDSVMRANFVGTFLCSQEAVRRMATSRGGRGGAIVNLSSAAARTGGYRLSPYVASKAAVEGLTRALAGELAAEGIRVNAVSPGVIATDQNPSVSPEETARRMSSIPVGRLGTPEEVAALILWLLSDEASYVTGAVVPVTGGK